MVKREAIGDSGAYHEREDLSARILHAAARALALNT